MRILIASGGSGGHIFPAIALARELAKDKKHEIVFVASRRKLDRGILKNTDFRKFYLSANPMPYKAGFCWVSFFIKLFFDTACSFFIILYTRPDVCVGFGGYTGGAIVLLASLLGIETIIHEQNVVPGRTNKFLDRFVSGVAISFPETAKYFKNKNIKVTGNPLREESLIDAREKARDKFGFPLEQTVILVMGGSQGARSLNRLVSESIIELSDNVKNSIAVLHIAGDSDINELEKLYTTNKIKGKVFTFIKDINEAYSVCDFAISRSGAAAVFELAAHRKPMILIPYPNPKNNQRFNALYFKEKTACIYKEEKSLTKNKLKSIINEIVNDPRKRKVLSDNAGKLAVIDGAKKLKIEIEKLLKNLS